MSPKPQTMRVQQLDLLGAPAQTVGVVTVAPRPREHPAPRKIHETQRAAHRASLPTRASQGPTTDERCRWEVTGNSQLGRTRQEIADRTGIKLQTVCGCVDRLLKAGSVLEPVIGYTEQGRPIHYVRDGGKVLANAMYRDSYDWLAFGQALERERNPHA